MPIPTAEKIPTPRCIELEVPNAETNKRSSPLKRKKKIIQKIRNMNGFSLLNCLEATKQRRNVFKILKGNDFQPRI